MCSGGPVFGPAEPTVRTPLGPTPFPVSSVNISLYTHLQIKVKREKVWGRFPQPYVSLLDPDFC